MMYEITSAMQCVWYSNLLGAKI